MVGLIEFLLSDIENHCVKQQARQRRINQEAMLIYNRAYHELDFYRSMTDVRSADIFAEALNVLITQELAKVNWRKPGITEMLISRINHWKQSCADSNFEIGLTVCEALIAILPHAQKKHQLQELCKEYQSYLKTEIESQLQIDHPKIYATYQADKWIMVKREFMNKQVAFRQLQPGQNMEQFVNTHREGIPGVADELNSAIKKYAAVNAMEKMLVQSRPAALQISDFRREFTSHQGLMKQGRDTALVKFIKGVASVLSCGVAVLAGVWRVKSHHLSKNIQKTLNEQHRFVIPRLDRGI